MSDSAEYLTAGSLAGVEGIVHGFFTRRGGVSEGVYDALNVGIGSNDQPDRVKENRRRVRRALVGRNLATPYQVHGCTATYTAEAWPDDDRPKADALVTDRPGLLIGVVTADCAPILLADGKSRIVGAAHAGWRGALAGIAESAVQTMVECGAGLSRIHAAIGPCIQQRSYEVGIDLAERFRQVDSDNLRFFKPAGDEDKFLFDLAGYVEWRLIEAGLGRVEVMHADTYVEANRFFSYRRSCHRGQEDFGRQVSAIGLR